MTAGFTLKRRGTVVGRRPSQLPRLQSWLPALRYCAGVYLAVRIGLFALGAAAWGLSSEHSYPVFNPRGVQIPQSSGWHNAVTGWVKLDAQQFLYVAQHWYSVSSSGAFYPGYPILIRAVSYLTFGHVELAGYIVSNAALLAALVVLYKLTEHEYDGETARRAVLYLGLFPTAFFLFDVYSESVFLLAVVGAIALARRGRWGWAGLAGIWATFTRATGVVVCLALAVEAIHQTVEARRRRAPDARQDRRRIWRATAGKLAASTLPLAGIGGYLLFFQLRYHSWRKPLTLEQTDWDRVFRPPWQTLWHGMQLAFRSGAVAGHGWYMLDFALVAVGLLLGIWVAVRARPVYAVYTWASIIFFLCSTRLDRPLVSDPRYLVVIFPLVFALARFGRRPSANNAVVAVSAAGLMIVSWLFLSTIEIY